LISFLDSIVNNMTDDTGRRLLRLLKKGKMDGEKSGGAALDLHIHDTDFVNYLFGKPRNVTSSGVGKFSKNGGVDHITTIYDYGKGITVVSEGTWSLEPTASFNMSFRIIFEKATLTYSAAEKPTLKLYPYKGKITTPKIKQGDGFVQEIKHFISCINGKKSSSEGEKAEYCQNT